MPTNISYQSMVTALNDYAESTISNVDKGRYSVYIVALLSNKNSVQNTVNFYTSINVNNDNPSYTTNALLGWSNGVQSLDENSMLQVQGATEIFLPNDNNTISARSFLHSGSTMSSNYTNQHILMLVRKYNVTHT